MGQMGHGIPMRHTAHGSGHFGLTKTSITLIVINLPRKQLQYSENIRCKLFEKNIGDELAIVHGMTSCVV